MSSKFLALILVIVGLFSLSLAASEKPSLVINFFRHGARGPISTAYNDGLKSEETRILTPVGMRQHYYLGAALVKTYPHLLDKPYDPKKIYVRSSAGFRAYQSAIAQLYGIFRNRRLAAMPANLEALSHPPFNQGVVSKVVKEQKTKTSNTGNLDGFKVFVIPEDQDIAFKPSKACPALFAQGATKALSSESVKFDQTYSNPTSQALKKLGVEASNHKEINTLADSMTCNHWAGRAQPGKLQWGTQLVKDVIFVKNWYRVNAAEKTSQKMSVPLFQQFFRFLDSKAAGQSTTEFVLFSAHDTTLLAVLTALKIVTTQCLTDNYLAGRDGKALPHPNCIVPPFASTILLEFYDEKDGSKSISLKYNDAAIPLCDGKPRCEYKQFKKLAQDATNGYTSKDYRNLCSTKSKKNNVEEVKTLRVDLVKQRADVAAKLFAH